MKKLIAFRSRRFIACHSNPSVLNNAGVSWCAKESRMRVLMNSGHWIERFIWFEDFILVTLNKIRHTAPSTLSSESLLWSRFYIILLFNHQHNTLKTILSIINADLLGCVRLGNLDLDLGNPDLDFQNVNPDFSIEREIRKRISPPRNPSSGWISIKKSKSGFFGFPFLSFDWEIRKRIC